MFRDLWHCCLLISDPVYLMVDSAYSGCCFGGSPVVTGIASSIYCELARPPRGFQNQIYRVGNPRYPIRVRRRKNLSPNPLRFAPAAKLSAHARRRHRRHSTSQPTHITAQYNPRTMPPSPQVCDARDCRHKQHPLSLDYFRKGDSPPECYLYFRRSSDCRRKKYNSFTTRDEHEASRGEASESHVRLASWTQSWNRLSESIPWNRLASPRHESKHLGLASTRSRRGELALELASRKPTRRLISPTVCYVKITFWWHAESFAT